MRAILALAVIAVALSSGMAPRQPITISESGYNTGAHRPWLDQTCYDDDHGYSFTATGWVDGTWTHVSPLPVCTDKMVKVWAQWKAKGSATVTLTDAGGHAVPIRYSADASIRFFKGPVDTAQACNTDLGVAHVQLADDAPGLDRPRGYVRWSVTGTGNVAITGEIAEAPWEGGEGSWDGCAR